MAGRGRRGHLEVGAERRVDVARSDAIVRPGGRRRRRRWRRSPNIRSGFLICLLDVLWNRRRRNHGSPGRARQGGDPGVANAMALRGEGCSRRRVPRLHRRMRRLGGRGRARPRKEVARTSEVPPNRGAAWRFLRRHRGSGSFAGDNAIVGRRCAAVRCTRGPERVRWQGCGVTRTPTHLSSASATAFGVATPSCGAGAGEPTRAVTTTSAGGRGGEFI